jgi:histidinol dehydrogenase
MNKIIRETDSCFREDFSNLLKKRKFDSNKLDSKVKAIIKKVTEESDDALISYTKRFDKFEVKNFKQLIVSKKEIDYAYAKTNLKTIKAIKHAYQRIKNYHKRQVPKDEYYKDKDGVFLGSQWKPIDSVGLYVPGGTASYPSSVLMNAIPAMVSGVKRIVMVVPAPNGKINPTILAVAKILKISEIYKIGGAQAIAALAYGTKSIRPVDKICGPGNAYVASAKKQVFGVVGIDMIAGPSEILVVADKNNNPRHIAIDLLSQAEHDELAQSILITDNEFFASKVSEQLENEIEKLKRVKIAKKSWFNFGAIIVVKKINNSIHLINDIAPEHLELTIANAEKFIKKINNAGAIFIGKYTPEAIGDYIAGPNHVLPTDRTAKFSSGLNVLDFVKRTSLVKFDIRSLKKIGPDAIILAQEEGLGAHALSISSRINED